MAKKPSREEIEETTMNSTCNREPKEMVSVGGTALTTSGRLTRSDFFRFIGHNLDDYEDVKLTKEEARKIHTHIMKLSTGSAAMVPIYCGGPKCPFSDRCPLHKIGRAPIARQCVIENQLLKEWILRYFDEYEVDPNNLTEIAYISELAEIEILLMRVNMNLSKPENAELVMDQIVGMSRDGETPLVQKNVSPFIDLKDRLQSRKSKIIKLMVGDRQEKYKKEAALKMKIDADPSSKMATTRARLETLSRQLDAQQQQQQSQLTPQTIIDAELSEED